MRKTKIICTIGPSSANEKIELIKRVRENLDMPIPIMLGHSSAGFTLATYTHATNKVQEQAEAKMGSLLKQAL